MYLEDCTFKYLHLLNQNIFGLRKKAKTKIIHNYLQNSKLNQPSTPIGLGLATLFRHACINRNCIVINGPNPSEIQNNNYKYNNKCYKYNAYAVSCDKN